LKICYVSINNSSQTPWPATGININIFAKPSSAGQSLFKIKNGNKRLVSGNVAVSSSRLVYYDNTKQERVAKGDFNKQIILREKFSDEIRRDLDLSGVKLYNALLAEGIKPEYGFWT
jgi:hypothetical protein